VEDNSPYLQRVQDSFPHLEIKQARANQDGLINDVLIVNDELVFRFPKNDSWARELLANEIKVIELARKHVEMPLPEIEYKADDLMVYRFIGGSALQQTDILKLNEDGQWRLVEQLATYLRQLHGVPKDEVKRCEISQSDVNRNRDVWLKLFEDVKNELFPLMMPHAREFVIEHFAQIVADENFMNYEPKLINGDTAPYHIIFDKESKRINGIIDFGTAGIGDPAADFACIIYNYGESFLRRMARFYSGIEEALDRARFWAGTLELQWALSGLRSQNNWWHLVHIGGAKDARPIGSD
jgi:aminoglycoside 2''-phosphotransferase